MPFIACGFFPFISIDCYSYFSPLASALLFKRLYFSAYLLTLCTTVACDQVSGATDNGEPSYGLSCSGSNPL